MVNVRGIIQRLTSRWGQTEPAPLRPDLHQVAIDSLLAQGTPFAAGLAAEIDRGRQRRHNGPDQNWDEWRDNQKAKHLRWKLEREFMLKQLRVAEPEEYDAWLVGCLESDRTSFRYCDIPTPQMWVAINDLAVRPLYGANSFEGIIVPKGLRDDNGDTGHTDLYYMRDFSIRGFHQFSAAKPRFVQVYRDTKLDKIDHTHRREIDRHRRNAETKAKHPRGSTLADDAAVLRMFGGATFGPGARLVLPTGRVLTGDEAALWVDIENSAAGKDEE